MIALPYLVLMKLQTNVMQDLVDIARMLAVADKQTLDAVRSAVQTHHPAASDDIERMIVLVKSENQ